VLPVHVRSLHDSFRIGVPNQAAVPVLLSDRTVAGLADELQELTDRHFPLRNLDRRRQPYSVARRIFRSGLAGISAHPKLTRWKGRERHIRDSRRYAGGLRSRCLFLTADSFLAATHEDKQTDGLAQCAFIPDLLRHRLYLTADFPLNCTQEV